MAKEIRLSYTDGEWNHGYHAAIRDNPISSKEPLETPGDVYRHLMSHAKETEFGERKYSLIVEGSVPREAVPEFTAFEQKVKKLSVTVEGKKKGNKRKG